MSSHLTVELCNPAAIAAGVGELAGWVVMPDQLTPPASVVVCLHGGGYTSSYYDLEVPGHGGYSMAAHLARLGHVVVAFDQPGVGGSSAPPDGTACTVDVVAASHHEATVQILERLKLGTLLAGVGPVPEVATSGIGHSMGGYLLAVQQARHGTFDRIAMLGTTGLPREWGGEFSFDIRSGYAFFERAALRHGFYWEDVPAEVIAADEQLGVTMPAGVLDAPQVAATLASTISVPVLLGLGERDISTSPHQEVGLFTGSNDVSLYVLPGSGHCSNFASGRATLWDRLSDWTRAVGSLSPGPRH
jgi:pimeloyl-ACP methyl ester carboxylesterase